MGEALYLRFVTGAKLTKCTIANNVIQNYYTQWLDIDFVTSSIFANNTQYTFNGAPTIGQGAGCSLNVGTISTYGNEYFS